MNFDDFSRLIDDVVASIPPQITSQIDNLTIEPARRPPPDASPDLLGLYEGVPLAERGFDYYGAVPDRIRVFYEPHIALGLDDAALRAEVRTTVLHEVGHHLGISDDRLHEIGWG